MWPLKIKVPPDNWTAYKETNPSAPLVFGSKTPYNGSIELDELKVYDWSLDTDEVMELYHSYL